MLKTLKRWKQYWKRGRQAKKYLASQIELTRKMGKAQPPTPEELEAFKKEVIWQ
jgi:hypothetical protein